MPQYLKPMLWPAVVPLLTPWQGDYADIRDRVRRDGRLDTIDDVYVPHSDDSLEAFQGRHGTYGWDDDWRELWERERAPSQRQAERVRQLQEDWEAERLRGQRAKQAEADRDWEAEAAKRREKAEQQRREAERHRFQQSQEPVKAARVFWAGIDPTYFTQTYYLITVGKTVMAYGVTFEAGRSYWVPTPVVYTIRGHGG